MTPYTLHPGHTLIVTPRYYGSIDYYAAVAAYEHTVVDYGARYDKRNKQTHRTVIADVNGPLTLTMPLRHPGGIHTRQFIWRDMTISPHGDWWNVHRIALESAYGRTPFFEFYIDRFLPVLQSSVLERYPTIEAVDTLIDTNIRQLLGLPMPVDTPVGIVVDHRQVEPASLPVRPYSQVRDSRLGFIEGLSILDLLFNLGPEACLWLRDHIKKQP